MRYAPILLWLIFWLLTVLSTPSYGQATLSGRVTADSADVPYATLALRRATDSTLAKAAVADAAGTFRVVGVPVGRYFLEATALGYEPYAGAPFDLAGAVVLPVRLTEIVSQLDEVTVAARRPLVAVLPDKTVFRVTDALTTAGTDGVEMLRQAPGVVLDNADNVVLEGKTGVQFYVDGRPLRLAGEDLTNYLRNLSAETVEAVELITQPSARYEAAGTAGIINLVLKKDQRFGTNGTLSGGYAYGRYGKENADLLLNHRTRRLSFSGNYGVRRAQDWRFMNLYRRQNGTLFDQESETLTDSWRHQARAGVDFFATPRSTFGATVSGHLYDGTSETTSRTPIRPAAGQPPTRVLNALSLTDNQSRHLNANLNYRFEDTLGHRFSADLDYGDFRNDRENVQPNTYTDGGENVVLAERTFRMVTPTRVRIAAAQADYARDATAGTFGLGAKFTGVRTDNTFEFFEEAAFDPARSNRFGYEEYVAAAYASYARQWGAVSLQLGLRAEQTHSEGTLEAFTATPDSVVRRRYLDWFPSGGLTYQVHSNHQLALTYSKRINRPNYQHLNPFRYVLNELSFQEGNPFLQPQYTHSAKLSHTFKYKLTTSLSFGYVRDFFAQVTDTLGAERNFMTTRNVADQQVYHLGVSCPHQINKWWGSYVSLSATYNAFTANAPGFQPLLRPTVSGYSRQSFQLPAGWHFEVSGWFSSPSIWGGTYRTRSLGSLDVAAQRQFMDNQLTLRVAFTDLFFTAPWRGTMTYGGLRIDGSGGYESRQLRLTLRYRFGNRQMKDVRLREGGLEDARERLD